MSLKIKVILAAIIILVTIVMTVSVFVYINSLNNKITDLNVTLAQQQNEIQALNCQIDSLEKNVESFRETINITNNYIENLEKVKAEEADIKEEIYEAVIEDPETKEWYEEELPPSLLEILMKETNDLTCNK